MPTQDWSFCLLSRVPPLAQLDFASAYPLPLHLAHSLRALWVNPLLIFCVSTYRMPGTVSGATRSLPFRHVLPLSHFENKGAEAQTG